MHAAVFVTPIPPIARRVLPAWLALTLTSRVLCSLLTCRPFIESQAMGGRPSPSSRYDVNAG